MVLYSTEQGKVKHNVCLFYLPLFARQNEGTASFRQFRMFRHNWPMTIGRSHDMLYFY